MIALIGPTRLELEPPPENTPALIEIALLLDGEGIAPDANTSIDHQEEVDCHHLQPWESQLMGERLDELHSAGAVRRRMEGNWLVYEVTPEICRMLLSLLLKRSPTPKPKAW